MYLDKYWGEYVGGTDDSVSLISFLEFMHSNGIAMN